MIKNEGKIIMNDFQKEYTRRVIEDRKVTEQMVADGEITEEEGYMRNDFRRLEILMEMPDDKEV